MKRGDLVALGRYQTSESINAKAPILKVSHQVAALLQLIIRIAPNDELRVGLNAGASREYINQLGPTVDLASYHPARQVLIQTGRAHVLDGDVFAVGTAVTHAHRKLFHFFVHNLALE